MDTGRQVFRVADLFAWMRNGLGMAGLTGGVLLWVFSAGALALAMRANLADSVAATGHARQHLHLVAMAWGLWFTALQLVSFLVTTFVLRAAYRLRAAVCFSVAAGLVMVGDVVGLLVLLIGVGVRLGTR